MRLKCTTDVIITVVTISSIPVIFILFFCLHWFSRLLLQC